MDQDKDCQKPAWPVHGDHYKGQMCVGEVGGMEEQGSALRCRGRQNWRCDGHGKHEKGLTMGEHVIGAGEVLYSSRS